MPQKKAEGYGFITDAYSARRRDVAGTGPAYSAPRRVAPGHRISNAGEKSSQRAAGVRQSATGLNPTATPRDPRGQTGKTVNRNAPANGQRTSVNQQVRQQQRIPAGSTPRTVGNTAPRTSGARAQGAKNPARNVNRNASPVLNDRQRAIYERAYYEKYGSLPYRNARQTSPVKPVNVRQDRRALYLKDEQEKQIRLAVERQRKEAERIKRAAEEARRAAEREERRRYELERQLEAKQRERENLRSYNAKRRELERARRREEEAREREEERRREKLRVRRRRIRAFKLHLKVFLAALLVVSALSAFVGYKAFYTDMSDPSRKVTCYFDGKKAYTSSKLTSYSDGKMCVNFTAVADHYGFYTVGDSDRLKYIIPDESGTGYDFIEFVLDSSTAFVNGTPVDLEAPSRYISSALWVPSGVFGLFDSGFSVKVPNPGRIDIARANVLDEKGKKVTDDNGDYVFETISTHFRSMLQPDKVDLISLYGDEAKGLGKGSAVAFVSDVSQYEEYMNPQDSNEFLILVNKDKPLDVTYLPDDLTALGGAAAFGGSDARLRLYAEKSLEAMFAEMRAAGIENVTVAGGFVSFNEQASLFANYVNGEMAANGLAEEEAKTAVRSYCDEAGMSDYQTGLNVRFTDGSESAADFAGGEGFKWLSENCWKFGYILRYPPEKSDVTLHRFDPTCFRFVGRFAAEIIHNGGSTLEEYVMTSPSSGR